MINKNKSVICTSFIRNTNSQLAVIQTDTWTDRHRQTDSRLVFVEADTECQSVICSAILVTAAVNITLAGPQITPAKQQI